jgi:hypothetical protein
MVWKTIKNDGLPRNNALIIGCKGDNMAVYCVEYISDGIMLRSMNNENEYIHIQDLDYWNYLTDAFDYGSGARCKGRQNTNIEERMNKLSESIAETNKLFAEITAELATLKESENNKDDIVIDVLDRYKDIRELPDYLYYLDEGSKIDSFRGEYKFVKDAINPYDIYPTEKLAYQAQKIKIFNDLCLAFKYCHDEDYQPDWDNYEYKYRVIYDFENNRYHVEQPEKYCCNVVHFSSREIAQKFANYLNEIDPNGEMVK